jgi:hypothetical protein
VSESAQTVGGCHRKLVQKKEVIGMVASSTMGSRLFKLCVATIVAIAMLVTMSMPTAAYADNRLASKPVLDIRQLDGDTSGNITIDDILLVYFYTTIFKISHLPAA